MSVNEPSMKLIVVKSEKADGENVLLCSLLVKKKFQDEEFNRRVEQRYMIPIMKTRI